MKYTYLIILTSLLLISCEDFFETTLELEEPVFEEQLVVNSIITTEMTNESRALISKTIGLNDKDENSLVSDAEVKITFPDGSEYAMDHVSNTGIYSQYNYEGALPSLISNQNYRIDVKSGSKSVSSTVTMPKPASLISAIYSENGGLNEDGNEVSAIDIIIDDIPNEANYYKIGAVRIIDNYSNPLYLDSNNALATESATYEDILINDDQFDGEDFKLRLQFYNFDSYYGGEPQPEEYKVIIRTITKEQYDYDKLLKTFRDNNDNPFASPVQISTNIEGGIGLFAIENVMTFDVE